MGSGGSRLGRTPSFESGEEVGLKKALETAEKYVGHVVEDWENQGQYIVADAPSTVVDSIGRLQAFLDTSAAGFEEGAATPMQLLQDRIREQTMG